MLCMSSALEGHIEMTDHIPDAITLRITRDSRIASAVVI